MASRSFLSWPPVAVDLRATVFGFTASETVTRRSAATLARPRAFAAAVAVLLFSLLYPFSAAAASVPLKPGAKPAFIERIPPADFLAVEQLCQHAFTATCEAVILKTEHGQVSYALTLRRDVTDGFIWDAYFITPGVEPKEPTVSIEFAAKITGQYISALNYRLSRWVTVVEKSHKPASYEGAWWIYYRVEHGAIAGLLDTADIDSLPEAKQFADLFIEGPKRLLVSDTAQQPSILEDIETKCRDIVQTELRK